MALTERVVLFHDFVPHGVAQTEVYGTGIGVVPGVVALPHARRRLQVGDPIRMSLPGTAVHARPLPGPRRRHPRAAGRGPSDYPRTLECWTTEGHIATPEAA